MGEAERHEAGSAGDDDAFPVPPSLERPDQLEAERVRAALRRRLFGADSPAPRLGRYELGEQIGAGAMGTVFLARDVELRRDVALKVIHGRTSAEQDETVRRRLLREARAMAKLRHPNVITVFEAGVVDDQAFIAMEYVDGDTLRGWLSERARSWAEILEVFIQAGRGLAAAHEGGLVHRDFKPENVLISRQGRVQVTDFGVARVLEGTSGDVTLSATAAATLDKTGGSRTVATEWTRAGTPRYMAPEQLAGEEIDERTDQFAFCVALFEALHGEPPFAGNTLAELTEAAHSADIRMPTTARRIPRWLARAIRRGLRPEREQRYPAMAALLVELQTDADPPRRWLGPAILASVAALGAYGLGQLSGPQPAAAAAGGEPSQPEVVLADDRAVISAVALASAAVAGAASAAATSVPATPPARGKPARARSGAPTEAKAELDAGL